MRRTAFDNFHPIVPALYFAFVLVYCMAAFHPLLVCLSLLAGLCGNAYLRGARATARTAAWQIPLLLLIALVNPLFSASGSTLLFVLGPWPIYAESLIYGLTMGAMLMAAMLWFSNAAAVMTSESVMSLTGARMPVIGLMISMVMRLVPQFVRRGQLVGATADATTAARKKGKKAGLYARVRQLSVLMGWSMEDSLDTSDAMRARGWGASARRTTYQRRSFDIFDGMFLAVFCSIALCVVIISAIVISAASFYPAVCLGNWWWAAIAYAFLLAIPVVLEVREWMIWR